MPLPHSLEEAKAVWERSRADAMRFWLYGDNGPIYNATMRPTRDEFMSSFDMTGPPDAVVNVYPFRIEFTPRRNGASEWRTYVITWGEHVIEKGTW